jgi:hypothetical protein
MTNINSLGLDIGLFSAIAETPEMFERSGRTAELRVGREVPFKATINGIDLSASAILHEARLTRLTLLEQVSPNTNKSYHLVTGIMRPVKMDLFVTIDGEKMNLIDLLHTFVNSGNTQITRQQFVETALKIGLDFENGMPFFFQQFGANIEGFKDALEAFKNAGAKDVIGRMSNPGRIQAAYEHETGVPVTAFEVGTVDRTKSRTGQGFLNLVDATVDNFQRIVRLRKEARLLEQKIASSSGWSQDKITKAKEQVKLLDDMSRQWASNWSGAQQRIVVAPNQKKETQNIWDPVNAPCGRFTMVVDNENVHVDLWSNSAKANTSDTSVGSSAPAVVTNEDPF